MVHHNSLVFLCGHSMVHHNMVWFGMVWASCVAPTAGDDGESTPAPPTAPNTPQEQTSHQTQSHFYRKQKKTKANSFCTMQCLNGNPVQYFWRNFQPLISYLLQASSEDFHNSQWLRIVSIVSIHQLYQCDSESLYPFRGRNHSGRIWRLCINATQNNAIPLNTTQHHVIPRNDI